MKIDSVHAEFVSGNAVSSTSSSHSIVSRDSAGDIHAAGVTIAGNPGTLFSYSDGTRSVYGGCDSNDPWFGTSSNHDLRLVTNSGERMRIDNTGNVGIGVTSPGYKLHVNGSSMFTSTINLTTSSGYAAIEMGGPSGAYIDLKNPASDDYDLRVITTGTGGAIQVGGVGDVMNFDGSGNVGIGTSSPIFPLDVTTYQHGNMTTPATWLNNTGSGIARTTITTSNFGDNISIRATHGIWTETFVAVSYTHLTLPTKA